jgi:hypothetical protein
MERRFLMSSILFVGPDDEVEEAPLEENAEETGESEDAD